MNVDVLEEQFEAGAEITPESLVEAGVLREIYAGLKILGNGEVSKKFTVKAHKFSQSATEKLVAAGGTVEVLSSARQRTERNPDKG